MKLIPSRSVLPLLATRSRSLSGKWPTKARLPIVPPSSFWKMITAIGCRVVMRRSCNVRATSIEESTPTSPS